MKNSALRNLGKQDSAPFVERVSATYSSLADWMQTVPWYQDRNLLGAALSMVPGEPRRILELCFGAGLVLEAAHQRFPNAQIFGVDISPRMVELANRRIHGNEHIFLSEGDWIYDIDVSAGPFDLIIVKNALHILDDLTTRLSDLKRICHGQTTLLLIETISPNSSANSFVRNLFSYTDARNIKQSFFTRKSLKHAVTLSGWHVDSSICVDQSIDVCDWLQKKCKNEIDHQNALTLISNANRQIRVSMNFDADIGIPSKMRRLQYIARCFPSEKSKCKSAGSYGTQLYLV